MKIKSIAAICKKNKQVVLFNRYSDSGTISQYIGDGSAVYPISGLPELDEESILTIFDVPEKQREDWLVRYRDIPEGISFEDTDTTEKIIEQGNLSIVYSGKTLKPLQTRRGLVFIESRYLSPVSDVLDALELYERVTPFGAPYIVAKAGFLLKAVIMPCDVISAQFVQRLQELTRQCAVSLDLREQERERQAAHDPTITETAQRLSLAFEKLKADISQSRAARFVLAVLEKLKGAIQMEKTLKTGKIGQFGAESRITYGGVKWVVLDARPNMSLCIAEDVLKGENGEVRYMAFDTDNKNDFAASSVRAFLNGDFLEELAAAGADKEAFVPIVLDLTSDDGLDDYGTDSAKIGLITDQMYRAFRKIIPKASEDYWTCTPFSTERNGYKSFVRYVSSSGALSYYYAYIGDRGVRPLCALKSDILVSYDEGEVNERKPSFGEMIGKALAEGLNKAIFGEGEEPKGILAEVEAQAAREKEQEDEEKKRADAVDMMKHIAAAFDIPATIGEGKQEEQEKEAKQLFGWYSELKKAGFTDAQAFELIKG